MSIGDKVHVELRIYMQRKLLNEWNGVIVDDLSYLGDGKRKIWGVDRINTIKDWNRKGSIAVGEEDLRLREDKNE